jgi:hypothetical protein
MAYSGEPSNQHPLTPSLDKFVQHKRHVREDEAADVEAKELGGMASGKLETNVSG